MKVKSEREGESEEEKRVKRRDTEDTEQIGKENVGDTASVSRAYLGLIEIRSESISTAGKAGSVFRLGVNQFTFELPTIA